MATVTATASKHLGAPPERVLAFLRDYRNARPQILTEPLVLRRIQGQVLERLASAIGR